MSAAQSQSTLEAKLKALECHFTWDIDSSRSKLLYLRGKLEDIGTEEGNSWLGHIYNLQGYIHNQLGFTEDARRFFSKAAEAFHRSRNTVSDEGPWLVVNYGNLAWLHHHLGEQAECQTYLSKVSALLTEYPSPSQDELHPEIYAEKAWTLMKFDKHQYLAADYFQRAIRMQPDMVQWNTSRVLALVKAYKFDDTPVEEDILEKLRMEWKQDPENLYLAAHYLDQRGRKGERIKDEACKLARKVLKNPVSSYSGMKALLRVYRKYVSVDEAVALAEEALEKHPDERYLKRCAALCYRWKVIFHNDSHLKQSTIDRGISLHKEVISLYNHPSLLKKISLANIYAKSNHSQYEAEKIYQELLQMDLEPAGKQMIYHYYAKHLNFDRRDYNRSIEYHMKAAEIPQQSYYRENSIKVLEKIKEKNRSRMCGEIEELLAKLEV
ncbi:interferon-induced protein with tetratricopeptide repeats 1B-like [Thunnus albacares]|uniref:interferon-induced protein with tetratricopeptide repeats 1B-like n=1 Tax=Thunnus albacares TaxID=8236 RepID=UPI001CF65920|nr:interferon-induced protein with tetratricopeptide repeats 1B-like [Thunnus albacares]